MTVAEAEGLVRGLRTLFEIVRLVNPETHHMLSAHADGKLEEYPCYCYDIWHGDRVCEDCLCAAAVSCRKTQERIEIHNGEIYRILCSPLEIEGRVYGLTCLSRVTDGTVLGAVNTAQLSEEYRRRNIARYIDPLTGLYNHRYFEDTYASLELEQAAALLEIDNLEAIRAEQGAAAADELIKSTANMIRDHIRGDDVLIRFQNNYFLLFFREIGKDVFFTRMRQICADKSAGSLSIGGAYKNGQTKITPDLLQARLNVARETGNTFYCPSEEPLPAALTEAERDIVTFSWEYLSIYALDTVSGKLTLLQAAGPEEKWIRSMDGTHYEACRQEYMERFVHPDDRKRFYEETERQTVLARLAEENFFFINHRILSKGKERYFQIKFARDPNTRGTDRILLGSRSADSQTRRSLDRFESEQKQANALRECVRELYSHKSAEEITRQLLRIVAEYYKAERAYICKTDKDGHFVKSNYVFYTPHTEWANLDALITFDEFCFPSWQEAFKTEGQVSLEASQMQDGNYSAYRLMAENGIERLAMAPIFTGEEISGFVGLDNPTDNGRDLFLLRSVAAFAYSEITRRSAEEMKNNEQLAVIAGLVTDYVHLAIANLKNNTVKVFRAAPEYSAETCPWENITDYQYKIQVYADRVIVPEEREQHLAFMNPEHILAALQTSDALYHEYAVTLNGKRVSLQTKIVRCAGSEESVLIGVKNVERERQREQHIREQLELTVAERTKELQVRNNLLNRLNEDMIGFLGGLTEARDKESGEHVNRVKGFTNILARQVMEDCPEYGLTEEKIEIITSASALHDLGKIMIPDSVLLKPGRLTQEEFSVMKSHCLRGAEILQRSPHGWGGEYLQTSLDIILCHHEKTDGRGYPNGLSGDAIPISAQIVSVADCFDALTTKRVYKDAYAPEVAFNMIVNGECGAFSDKLLACMKKCRDKFERYARGEEIAETDYSGAGYSSESLTGLRILLAEDNEISRSIMQEILEGEGAEVLGAENGQRALDILRTETRRIDAVLTDIDMPVLDGPGLARGIRNLPDGRVNKVPILALTSYTDAETENICRRAGMDAFLTKPVTISALTKNLLVCLKNRSEDLQKKVTSLMNRRSAGDMEGVHNMSEYTDMVQKLTEELLRGAPEPFALLDADINGLRAVNRLYGYEVGDEYLKSCSRFLIETFPESLIYRVGGDEFAVLIRGKEYEEREQRLTRLEMRLKNAAARSEVSGESVSFAYGLGCFDKERDLSVSAVFARAEEAMRAKKAQTGR